MGSSEKTIVVTIEASKNFLDAESAAEIILNHARALESLSQHKGSFSKRGHTWVVSKVMMSSPLQWTMTPAVKKADTDIKWYIKGIHDLSEGFARPRYFDNRVLRSVKRITDCLNNGVASISVSSEDYGEETYSLQIGKNLEILDVLEGIEDDEIEEKTSFEFQPHEIETSLCGDLDDVFLHDKRVFRIYDPLTGFKSKCQFDDDIISVEDIGRALNKRVFVRGLAAFDGRGKPISIKVKELVIPDEKETKARIEDLDINITGKMNSVDYVRSVRRGKKASRFRA